MKLKIIAIGKLKSGPESELFSRYLERARRSGVQLGFSAVILQEYQEDKSATAKQRKSREGIQLMSSVSQGSSLLAFDENGDDLTSEQFAKYIADNRDNGIDEMAFVIGGPDGQGQELLMRANKTIRLGSMTWPHQIARILLAEQIYRAMTILSGHPYHRS